MPIDPKRLMTLAIPARDVSYAERDSILYALAVGFGANGMHSDQPFVWEAGLKAVPSMATVLDNGHAVMRPTPEDVA